MSADQRRASYCNVGLVSLRLGHSIAWLSGDHSEDAMAVSEKSCETTPHMRGAVFLCLLLLSLIFFSGAFAVGSTSSLAAGLQHHAGLQFVSTSPQSEDDCPSCPACDHSALTGCCSASTGQFMAIASEPTLRHLNAQTVTIPSDYLLPVSSEPSQVFRPPRLKVQA